MAVIETHVGVAGPTSFAGRARASLTHFAALLSAWNDRRLTRKALGSLSDRELDDIGLWRGMIDDLR